MPILRFLLAAPALILVLAQAPPAGSTPGDVLYVQAEAAELRTAPDPDAPALRRLAPGGKILEFERRGRWLRVAPFGAVGLEGWVLAALVGPRAPGEEKEDTRATGEPSAAPSGSSRKPDSRSDPLLLVLSGKVGLAFVGECREAGGERPLRRVRIEGFLPARYLFDGPALSCRVRKDDFHGRLRAEIRVKDDSIAWAETAAAFNHVRVRSDGPWGPAQGVRGAIPAPRITIAPEAARRIVPPLTGLTPPRLRAPGNPVPPLTGTSVPPLR